MGASFGYLGERLIIFAATVLISVTVVFFVPRLVPGDPLGAIFANLPWVAARAASAMSCSGFRTALRSGQELR